jgi:hypothetical protein
MRMGTMIARVPPFPHQICCCGFVTQQLEVSGREIALFQPLPRPGKAQVAVKTLHNSRDPKFNIAVKQVLFIEQMPLAFWILAGLMPVFLMIASTSTMLRRMASYASSAVPITSPFPVRRPPLDMPPICESRI